MKRLLSIGLLVLCSMVWSQTKAIHFTYKKTTKYVINDEGVFADTMLLKIDFPNMRFSKRQHPADSTVCGFIKLNDFKGDDRRRLWGTIYHVNEKMEGTYDVQADKTIINVTRNDLAARQILKKYFKRKYSVFKYKIVIDYKAKTTHYDFPSVDYKHPFADIMKTIAYSDDSQTLGTYQEKRGAILYENLVFLDPALHQKITPEVFGNNNFGVKKIDTIYQTIELTSTTVE